MNILYICILLYVVSAALLLLLGKYYYILGLHKTGPRKPLDLSTCLWPVVNTFWVLLWIIVLTILGICTLVAYIADLAGIYGMYKKLEQWYDNNLT